jgi:hypothetical protein
VGGLSHQLGGQGGLGAVLIGPEIGLGGRIGRSRTECRPSAREEKMTGMSGLVE